MDDTPVPPVPPEEDEVVTPMLRERNLVALDGGAEAELDEGLDFDIAQIVPHSRPVMGPGTKGRTVPYLQYGWAAVCAPQTQLLAKDGKRMAIIVPLPPSGMLKMSELKKLANKIWREARQQEMND